MHTEFWSGNQSGKQPFQRHKNMPRYENVEWIQLPQDTTQRRALLNVEIKSLGAKEGKETFDQMTDCRLFKKFCVSCSCIT
jgi:hypothetical protein